MAHLIDNSKGFNAFISYQMPAWHGLGEIFTTRINNAQEALEKSGSDFMVIKAPNIHVIGDNEIISTDSFFTYRTDVNKVLGSRLGKDYEVLQNAEAFNVVDEILQSGHAEIETAGVIQEGRRVFILLKVDKSIFVGTDEVKQYLLITNSHDGSLALTIMFTNVRVVCHNTLSAALAGAQGAIKIRHTSNAADRLNEAAKVLKLINSNTEANTENYSTMKAHEITKADMLNYFGNIFCTPEEIKKAQAGTPDPIGTRKINTLQEVAKFAANGIGQREALTNGNLNLWYAYNAVTGYITARKSTSFDDRANNMLFGSGAATIQAAGVLALNPAKIQPMHKIINTSGLNLN